MQWHSRDLSCSWPLPPVLMISLKSLSPFPIPVSSLCPCVFSLHPCPLPPSPSLPSNEWVTPPPVSHILLSVISLSFSSQAVTIRNYFSSFMLGKVPIEQMLVESHCPSCLPPLRALGTDRGGLLDPLPLPRRNPCINFGFVPKAILTLHLTQLPDQPNTATPMSGVGDF